MKTSMFRVFALLTCALFCMSEANAQLSKDEIHKYFQKASFLDLRGTNSIDFGLGTAVPNNDFPNPQFEIYFKGGYKRYITPHFYFGLDYHKFNLANKDLPNSGFMSFDFNATFNLMPYSRFTPYVFLGAGITASNYFDDTFQKFQMGIGVEYMLVEFIGVTCFTDYNYHLDDTLDGFIFGDSNDTYFRIGVGLNFYFGGSKKQAKYMKNVPTVINSNLLDGQ